MYLVTGHIYTGDDFEKSALVRDLTRERLVECKNDPDCMVIDLEKLRYFDPKNNRWTDLKISRASVDRRGD